MEDKLLTMFFEPERWQKAIDKGIGKDIRKDQLYKLTKTSTRQFIYRAIRDGLYQIAPPHTAQIPKDTPGEFRTVYINEPIDRVLLSIANDLLFETCADMVHPRCKSYQMGIGCGKVVREVSRHIVEASRNVSPNYKGRHPTVGFKSDLSKYFDSVPVQFIDEAFDAVEQRHGHSALIDLLRKYYHMDIYFDSETGRVERKFQSLKQGCAVASWLADVLLFDLDEQLDRTLDFYVRYSDDMLCIGSQYRRAMEILERELARRTMRLNPKKVEYLDREHWFKFLGFSIRGESIDMSPTRIKTFQREIEARTIHNDGVTLHGAVSAVNNYLYRGDGNGHSWATGVLPVVNVTDSLMVMNEFVMDALRAVATGHKKIGGLGYNKVGRLGCIVRGRGRNVKANRANTDKDIGGYYSLNCMHNAIITSRELYNTLVEQL